MLKFRSSRLVLILLMVGFIGSVAVAASFRVSHSAGGREASLQQWRDMKYGMFIHWGIYSLCEGIWKGEEIPKLGEQIQRHASIPQDEYAALAKRFNPVKFDADEYVRIAKNAGMKYIILTSKHHDGFNMFHTKLSDYNIVDATPYKKDIVKQLADACKRGGLKFGLYYSTPDWGYPKAVKRDPANAYSVFETLTPAHEEYMVGQLEELLTNYGPMCELFFDMGSPTEAQSKRFAETVKRLQPGCMINGRVMNNQGDFLTMPDNKIPDEVIEMAWETPATLYLGTNTNTWGYKSWVERHDVDEKVNEQIRLMAKVVSQGGNYLLNVGPKSDGTIIDYEIEVLEKMGDWMRVNGEAIYEVKPTPFTGLDFGYCTVKNPMLYFFVEKWPKDGKIVVPGLQSKVKKAYFLKGKSGVDVSRKGKDVVLSVGGKVVDERLTVIAVEVAGEIDVINPYIEQGPDGVFELTEANAFSHGVYTAKSYKSLYRNIWLSWDVMVVRGGKYSAEIVYKLAKGSTDVEFSIGGQVVSVDFSDKKKAGSYDLGSFNLKRGRQILKLRPADMDKLESLGVEVEKIILKKIK